MRHSRLPLLLTLLPLVGLAACSDSQMGEVSLQLATRRNMPSAEAAALTAPGQLGVTLGADEIVFDQVQLVLRKIRLDGAPTASCPEDAEGDAQCGEVRLGPVLFDLPLDDDVEPALTGLVAVGTYDRFKFQIHKPSDANGDAALVAAHPEMEDVSIRATSTYNGAPFTFTSDLTTVEELSLAAAVEVAADGQVPITLHVDAAGWFVNEAGTGLVDPMQASDGEPHESLVERNIRESFRAFRDADRDAVGD